MDNGIDINLIKEEVMKTSNLHSNDIRVVLMPETKGIRIFLTKDVGIESQSISDMLLDYVREFGFNAYDVDIYSIPQWEVVNYG